MPSKAHRVLFHGIPAVWGWSFSTYPLKPVAFDLFFDGAAREQRKKQKEQDLDLPKKKGSVTSLPVCGFEPATAS